MFPYPLKNQQIKSLVFQVLHFTSFEFYRCFFLNS